jgi:transcriptional regulator with XRE-family HTH domain
MKRILSRDTAYMFSDNELFSEICRRLKTLRLGSCLSREEFASLSGVSLSTIKRIESGVANDVGIRVIMKLLRAGGSTDGLADLVEETPIHPALKTSSGKRVYSSSKKRHVYESN